MRSKRTLCIVLVITLILGTQSAFALSQESQVSPKTCTIEMLPDGSYFETIIEDVNDQTMQTYSTTTKTKTKTTYHKNVNGEVLWYVSVTGTFTYGNGTAKCTSASPKAASENVSWKVSGVSGSKSGNNASATAIGKQYHKGEVISAIKKTVTLTCSPTGVFS